MIHFTVSSGRVAVKIPIANSLFLPSRFCHVHRGANGGMVVLPPRFIFVPMADRRLVGSTAPPVQRLHSRLRNALHGYL